MKLKINEKYINLSTSVKLFNHRVVFWCSDKPWQSINSIFSPENVDKLFDFYILKEKKMTQKIKLLSHYLTATFQWYYRKDTFVSI